jgi:F-type H+-transporting ATPase subunit delta
MSEAVVAKRYARALLNIASEKKLYDQFAQDLSLLNATFELNPDFETLLSHPRIALDAKKDMLKQAFSGKMSEDVLSLILLLVESGRENVIPDLVKEYIAMANDAQNIVDATVYSTFSLSEAELSKLSAEFGKTIGKTIRLKAVLDPSIVGGLLIRIGDRLYDGSVRGKLSRFRQTLVHS